MVSAVSELNPEWFSANNTWTFAEPLLLRYGDWEDVKMQLKNFKQI